MPCVKKAPLPKWNARRGVWMGGDTKTLYTWTDKRINKKFVRPGAGPRRQLRSAAGAGPEVTAVRLATKAEAEKYWQKPLHAGWKVSCPRRR